MALHEMSHGDTLRLLSNQRVVRVCFHAFDELYLIPFGYTWLDGCLFGVTAAGHKTAMVAASPRVSFQVDDSDTTGPWGWRSVTGEGIFEIVGSPTEVQRLVPAVLSKFADAPEWFQAEEGARAQAGELLVWQITPSSFTGRKNGPAR